MMCGVIPLVTTEGLLHALPPDLHWLVARDISTRREALRRLQALSGSDRQTLTARLRQIAIEHHSLRHQIQRLYRLCT